MTGVQTCALPICFLVTIYYTDITEWPQNIHEYHQMIATAQVNAMKLKELEEQSKAQKEEPAEGSKTAE